MPELNMFMMVMMNTTNNSTVKLLTVIFTEHYLTGQAELSSAYSYKFLIITCLMFVVSAYNSLYNKI